MARGPVLSEVVRLGIRSKNLNAKSKNTINKYCAKKDLVKIGRYVSECVKKGCRKRKSQSTGKSGKHRYVHVHYRCRPKEYLRTKPALSARAKRRYKK